MSEDSMTARYGSQLLTDRLLLEYGVRSEEGFGEPGGRSDEPESVVTSLAGFEKSGSVVTSLTGFAGSESVVTSLARFAARSASPASRWPHADPGRLEVS